jgi:hypothetical protein
MYEMGCRPFSQKRLVTETHSTQRFFVKSRTPSRQVFVGGVEEKLLVAPVLLGTLFVKAV